MLSFNHLEPAFCAVELIECELAEA